MTMKEQSFRMFYDNRRKIIEPTGFNGFDLSKNLMDSSPVENTQQCKTLRFHSKFPITNPFNKNNANKTVTGYKSKIEIAVRNFIKGYYSKNNTFGFKGDEFKNYKDIITFINGDKSTQGVKMSLSSISKLKNRKVI